MRSPKPRSLRGTTDGARPLRLGTDARAETGAPRAGPPRSARRGPGRPLQHPNGGGDHPRRRLDVVRLRLRRAGPDLAASRPAHGRRDRHRGVDGPDVPAAGAPPDHNRRPERAGGGDRGPGAGRPRDADGDPRPHARGPRDQRAAGHDPGPARATDAGPGAPAAGPPRALTTVVADTNGAPAERGRCPGSADRCNAASLSATDPAAMRTPPLAGRVWMRSWDPAGAAVPRCLRVGPLASPPR